jgi:hypothetical protein
MLPFSPLTGNESRYWAKCGIFSTKTGVLSGNTNGIVILSEDKTNQNSYEKFC